MSEAPPYADEDEGARPGGGRRIVVGAIAAAVVLGVIALLVVGLVNQDVGTSIDDALEAGERPEAPEMALPLLQDDPQLGPAGTEVRLSDLRGDPVVVNFWASWCVPCEREAPILESVWDAYRARGVRVLGVDTQDLSGEARAFLARTDTTYPSVRDGTKATEEDFQTTGVPETFLVDQEGRIAHHVIGELSDERQITRPLEQLL